MLNDDVLPTPRVPRAGECSIPSVEFCDSLGLFQTERDFPVCFVFKDFICPMGDRPARFRAAAKYGRLAGGQPNHLATDNTGIDKFFWVLHVIVGWLCLGFRARPDGAKKLSD